MKLLLHSHFPSLPVSFYGVYWTEVTTQSNFWLDASTSKLDTFSEVVVSTTERESRTTSGSIEQSDLITSEQQIFTLSLPFFPVLLDVAEIMVQSFNVEITHTTLKIEWYTVKAMCGGG